MLFVGGTIRRGRLRTAQLTAVLCCGSLAFVPGSRASFASLRIEAAAPVLADAAMGQGLSLHTLNVFGLPWPVGRDVTARCAAIGAQLTGQRPTVVALQEVWDDESRRAFALPGYHRAYGDGPLGLFAQHGLVTLSLAPIVRANVLHFSSAADADRCVQKGALHTRLDLGAGRQLDVFNVHLQSGREHRDVRLTQVRELAGFVTACSTGPFALLGDLNCSPGDTEFELLRSLLPHATTHCSPGLPTYDHTCNALACPEPPCEIDHILLHANVTACSVRRTGDGPGAPLSDHFGVAAELTFQGACRH